MPFIENVLPDAVFYGHSIPYFPGFGEIEIHRIRIGVGRHNRCTGDEGAVLRRSHYLVR